MEQLENELAQRNAVLVGEASDTDKIVADPVSGDHFYTALYSYQQNGETITRRTDNVLRKAGISVSVDFNANNNSQDTDVTNPKYNGEGEIDEIFPEKAMPGDMEDVHDTIGVKLTYTPSIPTHYTDQLHLRIFDPDNPAGEGPDGENYDANGDDADDNYKGVVIGAAAEMPPDHMGALMSHSTPVGGGPQQHISLVIDVAEETTANQVYFRVVHAQPGNNWLVAVHNKSSVLSSLDFQNGTDDLTRTSTQGTVLVPDENVTDQLLAKRTLWIELDTMVGPDTKIPGSNETYCEQSNWDTAEDPCEIIPVDETALIDFLEEYLNGPVTNIVPKLVPLEADPSNPGPVNQRPVMSEFKQYQKSDSVADNIKDIEVDEHFWGVHVVSAYEGDDTADADGPDRGFREYALAPLPGQIATLGYSFGAGDSALVFTEEIRDLRHNKPDDMVELGEAIVRTAAHEIMHFFFGDHSGTNTGPTNENLMSGVEVLASDDFANSQEYTPSTDLTPEQFQVLQSRLRPR